MTHPTRPTPNGGKFVLLYALTAAALAVAAVTVGRLLGDPVRFALTMFAAVVGTAALLTLMIFAVEGWWA